MPPVVKRILLCQGFSIRYECLLGVAEEVAVEISDPPSVCADDRKTPLKPAALERFYGIPNPAFIIRPSDFSGLVCSSKLARLVNSPYSPALNGAPNLARFIRSPDPSPLRRAAQTARLIRPTDLPSFLRATDPALLVVGGYRPALVCNSKASQLGAPEEIDLIIDENQNSAVFLEQSFKLLLVLELSEKDRTAFRSTGAAPTCKNRQDEGDNVNVANHLRFLLLHDLFQGRALLSIHSHYY